MVPESANGSNQIQETAKGLHGKTVSGEKKAQLSLFYNKYIKIPKITL